MTLYFAQPPLRFSTVCLWAIAAFLKQCHRVTLFQRLALGQDHVAIKSATVTTRSILTKTLTLFGFLIPINMIPCNVNAGPLQDQQLLKQWYQKKFPQLQPPDYANGVYAIDEIARESWLAIEEFPPYEPAIDDGKVAFETPFKNAKTYADCFPEKGIGIANTYPRWDDKTHEVITLPVAINNCRIANGEPPLPYQKGPITALLAYMAYTARGKPIAIDNPADNSHALKAYEQGKRYYYQRRGQLNFSCASCHIQNTGRHIRAETLSPMLGHTSGWPTYRLKWGEMGTLHRRFIGCHRQIRATPLPPQSREYRNLEYFMSFISNGIPINGPVTRK